MALKFDRKKTDAVYDAMEVEKEEKKDFTSLVESSIAQAQDSLKATGDIKSALEMLFAVEKQTRLASDIPATCEVALAIVNLAADSKNWDELCNAFGAVVKRRAQLKQVVIKCVTRVIEILDLEPEEAKKVQLIETIRDVTEGKLDTELERARLTRQLAAIKEKNGDIIDAAELMQEVQVETYGTMERREKIDFILEQVRLCMDRDDMVRAYILFKKVNPDHLKDDELIDLKLRFYKLAVQLYGKRGEDLEQAKCWKHILDTKSAKDNAPEAAEAFISSAVMTVLAKHSNERADMIARLHEVNIDALPQCTWANALLGLFKKQELVRWEALIDQYGDSLAASQVVNARGEDEYKARLQQLKDRVAQHNVLVLGKYYSTISMQRACQLLQLDAESTETFLRDMSTDGHVSLKIDRPAGTVRFGEKPKPETILNDWSHNISELLVKLERVGHLVNKENMQHEANKRTRGR